MGRGTRARKSADDPVPTRPMMLLTHWAGIDICSSARSSAPLNPAPKLDEIPVLIGPQGNRKIGVSPVDRSARNARAVFRRFAL